MSTKRVIDLRQLDYFVRVAELGSFTKAAGALNVAQSALSRQVSLLERQFGTRLLHRTGRGVLVTEEGQRALHAMRSLLADAEHGQNLLGAEELGITYEPGFHTP